MSEMSNKRIDGVDAITKDTVYREMYTEMRRFRDYEFSSSTWYNAFLTAMLAGIIAARWGTDSSCLRILLDKNYQFKFGVSVLAIVTGGVALYFVCYCRCRYEELRKWMDDSMEPTWKGFTPKGFDIQPHCILLITPLILALLVIVATWY